MPHRSADAPRRPSTSMHQCIGITACEYQSTRALRHRSTKTAEHQGARRRDATAQLRQDATAPMVNGALTPCHQGAAVFRDIGAVAQHEDHCRGRAKGRDRQNDPRRSSVGRDRRSRAEGAPHRRGPARQRCTLGGARQVSIPVEHLPVTADTLAPWVQKVRKVKVDVLVLDCPPHLDAALGAAISLADLAILPCGPSGLDMLAMGEVLGVVRAVRQRRDDKPIRARSAERVDRRTSEGRELVDELAKLGEPVGPALAYRSAFVRAFNTGDTVGVFAPGSRRPGGEGFGRRGGEGLMAPAKSKGLV